MGNLGQRVPEIFGRGVGKGMLLQIGAHAGAERLFAEVRLEHPQDRSRLAVGNQIERRKELRGIIDVDSHGMRGTQRVDVDSFGPPVRWVPVWPPLPQRLARYPGGETLVEPGV